VINDRRLKIAAVVMMATAAADLYPTIWGDGVHDDTAGFEAMVCKRLFRYLPDAMIVSRTADGTQLFRLTGTYLLPDGIPVPKESLINGPFIIFPAAMSPKAYRPIDCGPGDAAPSS
jgi:hypothetical protein